MFSNSFENHTSDGFCESGDIYRLTGLNSTCDSVDMVGSGVTEKLVPINTACSGPEGPRASRKILGVGTASRMRTTATDKYLARFLESGPDLFYTCTDNYIQELYVNDVLVQRHQIGHQYTITGHTCNSVVNKTVLPVH